MRIWFVLLRTLVAAALLFAAACSAPKHPSVEDLTHRENFSGAKLMALRGTRDGAALDAEAVFSGQAMLLTMKLRFAIGTPTTLMSGTWMRIHPPLGAETGTISARDVSFLGGQAEGPSIGGTFDLVDMTGMHKYRVVIPLQVLQQRLDQQRSQP